MDDFFFGQCECFSCRKKREAVRFRFTEHFDVVFGIPERRAAVFGEHLDKHVFNVDRRHFSGNFIEAA